MSEIGLEDFERMDRLCDRFEADWNPDARIDFSPYLDQVEERLQPQLVLLLVEIDVAFRISSGLTIDLSLYRPLGESVVERAKSIQVSDSAGASPRTGHLSREKRPATDRSLSFQENAIPERIGPYVLQRKLGEGGMGTVWQAGQKEPIERQVAIKLIRSDLASEQVIARFESERRAIALMDHPNIARILEAGWLESGHPYFVMELVDGVPITDFCDQHVLGPDERLKLFCDVCSAVQHAHQKGVIHRDLKPNNILVAMVEGKPVAKVIDFGLAKAINGDEYTIRETAITEIGQIMGTIQYMSPEQAGVKQLDVDTRSDIYSLGIILYELLTGSTPIDRKTIRKKAFYHLLEELKDSEPPRPSEKLSSLHNEIENVSQKRNISIARLQQILRGDLDWIVMKAIEKNRIRRYSSVSDFALDIENYLHDEPVSARPPSRIYRLRKYIARNRIQVGIAFSVLALLATALILSFGFVFYLRDVAKKEKDLRDVADQKTLMAKNSEKHAQANATEATRQKNNAIRLLARSNHQLAEAKWKDGRPQESLDYLDQIPQPFRKFEWFHGRRKLEGSFLTLYGHQSPIVKVKIAPGNRRAFSLSEDGILKLWDLTSGKELASIYRGNQAERIDILSDGTRKLYTGQRKELYSLGVVIATHLQSMGYMSAGDESGKGYVGRNRELTCFSANADRLISVETGNRIILLDTDDGSVVARIPAHQAPVFKIAIHPQRPILATCSEDRSIKVWSTEDGKLIREFPQQASAVSHIEFLTGLNRLVSRNNHGEVKLWRIDSGMSTAELSIPKPDNLSNHFGNLIVSRRADKIATDSGKQVHLFSAIDGRHLQSLIGHEYAVAWIAFNQSGNRLISLDTQDNLRLWDTTTAKTVLKLDNCQPNDVRKDNFSPNGHFLVVNGSLFDTTNGTRLEDQSIDLVSFHPDGTLFATPSDRGQLALFDGKSNLRTGQLSGHQDQVNHWEFSTDGSLLISGGDDNLVKIWNLTGTATATSERIELPTDDLVGNATPHPSNPWVALQCNDGTTIVWDLEHYRILHHFQDGRDFSVPIHFHPTQNVLAYIGKDDRIILRDLSNGEQILTMDINAPGLPGNEPAKNESEDTKAFVSSMRFSPKGKFIASGDSKNRIIIWDATNGKTTRIVNRFDRKRWEQRIWWLDWSSDGKRIVTGDSDSFATVIDIESGKVIRRFGKHIGQVSFAFFADQDTQLVTLPSAQNLIRTWDIESGKLISTNPINKTASYLWAASATGNLADRMVAGDSPIVSRFEDLNAALERNLMEQDSPATGALLFSHDYSTFCAGTHDGSLLTWKADSEVEYEVIRGHTDRINCVAVDRHQRLLATGSDDQTVRIWSKDGTLNFQLETRGVANDLAFSQNSERLLVAVGTAIEIWDLKNQIKVHRLEGKDAEIRHVGFLNDEQVICATTPYRKTLAWDASSFESKEVASPDPTQLISLCGRNMNPLFLGERQIQLVGKNILLVNPTYRMKSRFQNRLDFLSEANRSWHQRRYDQVAQSGDDYAACFHLAWMIHHESENTEYRVKLGELVDRWKSANPGDDPRHFFPEKVLKAIGD